MNLILEAFYFWKYISFLNGKDFGKQSTSLKFLVFWVVKVYSGISAIFAKINPVIMEKNYNNEVVTNVSFVPQKKTLVFSDCLTRPLVAPMLQFMYVKFARNNLKIKRKLNQTIGDV